MEKVCVATYCDWNNYGSMMQSIGLKNSLKKLGYESFIVKDSPAPPSKYRSSLHISKSPKALICNAYKHSKRSFISKKYENTINFMNKNIDICYYNNYSALAQNPPKADHYIAGSDQIWKFRIYRPLFFLDFVPEFKKRISYSASMGVANIPEKNKEKFSEVINKFDYISVREIDNKELIEQYTDKAVDVHIDPAFLCTADEWREYEHPYDIKKPYILLYTIYWDKELNRELKKLHKKTGLDVVAICNGASTIWANQKLFDVDPGQFLWLIDNAEAVITSSFHGTSFSIIFNKKLAAVINPSAPSRINYLLSRLSVNNSSIENVTDVDLSFYEQTNENIAKARDESMEYLKRVLSDE